MHSPLVRVRSVREDAPQALDARGLQHEELKLAEPAGVVRTRPKRSHFAGRGGREPDERQSCAAAKRALRFGDSEVVRAWDECDDERDGREVP